MKTKTIKNQITVDVHLNNKYSFYVLICQHKCLPIIILKFQNKAMAFRLFFEEYEILIYNL